MKNNILAICDPEQEYAYRLTDALSQNGEFPYEILTFTNAGRLQESLLERPAELLLIAESVYDAKMQDLPAAQLLLLWEDEKPSAVGLPGICKYSSVGKIRRKILETAMEAGKILPALTTDVRTKLYGLYTPIGRCLQTSFAFTMGQLLSRSHKVLYVNLECFSGLGKLLGRSFESGLSDILYYLQEPAEKLLARMDMVTERVENLAVLPPVRFGFEIQQIQGTEWQTLLDLFQLSRYEYVILDLSDSVQGLTEILRRCDRVFTIVKEDAFAAAKLAEYEEMLMKAEGAQVLEKTEKCRFPVFTKLPRNIGRQTIGELAEYTERLLAGLETGGI